MSFYPKRIEMMKGARIIIENQLDVKRGEHVLVITDTATPISISETLAAAAREREAEVVLAVMHPLKIRHQDLPPELGAAMKEANVVIYAVSVSPFHSPMTGAALKAGARVCELASFTEDRMISGGIEADFVKQRPIVEKVAQLFKKAKVARVTSDAGTNLTMNIEERATMACHNVAHEPGQVSLGVIVEANVSPKEGTTQGVLVCDGSVAIIGLIRESIRCTIKDGMITKIEGGEEADRLRAYLETFGDPMVYNIAEFAIGLNPRKKLDGYADLGAYGCSHIGIGSNISWGYDVKAATHLDLVMCSPRVELDGQVILENGELEI